MARDKLTGKTTLTRSNGQGARRSAAAALMSKSEIHARITASFPALPLGLQDAYVRLMETSVARASRAQRRAPSPKK